MSVSTRTLVQDSEIIQDNMPVDNTLDGPGDTLTVTLGGSTKSMAKLYRWIIGLSKVLGEPGRRRGYGKFNGPDIELTGTITSNSTTVTGSGTAFLTELQVGDFIKGNTNDEFREVAAIASDTSLTITEPFTSAITIAETFKRMQTLSERIESSILLKSPRVRQTVIFGRRNASTGVANFIEAGTGLQATIRATAVNLQCTWAGGMNNGPVDYSLTINADFNINSLTPSATNYLYLNLNTGTMTAAGAATTVAPQEGTVFPGSPSNGDYFYDTTEEAGYVYNSGTVTWDRVYRLYIGQAVTDVSSVTSAVTYALNGIYESGWVAATINTNTSFNDNIGTKRKKIMIWVGPDSAGSGVWQVWQDMETDSGTDRGFRVNFTSPIVTNVGTSTAITTASITNPIPSEQNFYKVRIERV